MTNDHRIPVIARRQGNTSIRRDPMDIYEAIYTTRSMRRLKPDPIPYEVQARILDAAIRAPHVGEMWRFLLVDDPAIKAQLAALYRQAFERMVGAQLGENRAALMQGDTP